MAWRGYGTVDWQKLGCGLRTLYGTREEIRSRDPFRAAWDPGLALLVTERHDLGVAKNIDVFCNIG